MRYIVQVRRQDRWIAIGHPVIDRKRAMEKLEAVLESGCYDRVRLAVVQKDETPAEIRI